MTTTRCVLVTALAFLSLRLPAQDPPSIGIESGPILRFVDEGRRLEVTLDDRRLLTSPADGLWSIASDFADQWPTVWHHGQPSKITRSGAWLVATGTVETAAGTWEIEDAYAVACGAFEGKRRWTWRGAVPATKTTLSLRFDVPAADTAVLLPGICYHGNPSGVRTGRGVVARFAGAEGERAVFEEHRYPMPFAAVEVRDAGHVFGAALHTLPSPTAYGNARDQWWSLGVVGHTDHVETVALSGPVAINGQAGMVKANQGRVLPYADAWLDVPPGAVIEKRFWLDVQSAPQRGDGFRGPLRTALDIHAPFDPNGLPSVASILEGKLTFADARWFESGNAAGFRMYPHNDELVMGWCGQADSAAYAMLVLGTRFGRDDLVARGRRSLDFLCTSPVTADGFGVRYRPTDRSWSQRDALSQGQALDSIAKAIAFGRAHAGIDTAAWQTFLRAACAVHADRILADGWRPESTSEAFLVAPLCAAARLCDEPRFARAATVAGEHYVARHRNLHEPYWGGTLDASCEDKEGAWAAFQAFLTLFDHTHDRVWLDHAAHAMDVALTYTYVWDVDLPAGRLRDLGLKTRGWTAVSAQNMHLDVFGVVYTPELWRMGHLLARPDLQALAEVMYRTCGQLIDPRGSQGEQIQQTNFSQHGDVDDVGKMRGGYAESWTVFWMTAHFLNAAAEFDELGVLDTWLR